ncbi:hypothetical protein [Geodermatophilus chilensis]|uniref:hypothetical protein n=1 Tax=Geodermatophilus chilensis TaxID=2035835 RepID=UPI0018E495DC|nr:hypothetical protein [Geodermatophilus chilensis]
MANLAQHLLDTAAEHGERPALRMDDAVLTYAGFLEAAAGVALEPGQQADPDELRARVEDRGAAYEYPRHGWLVEPLPERSTGRILRRAVEVPAEVRA